MRFVIIIAFAAASYWAGYVNGNVDGYTKGIRVTTELLERANRGEL